MVLPIHLAVSTLPTIILRDCDLFQFKSHHNNKPVSTKSDNKSFPSTLQIKAKEERAKERSAVRATKRNKKKETTSVPRLLVLSKLLLRNVFLS